MKRLALEELERREMLIASVEIAAITNSSLAPLPSGDDGSSATSATGFDATSRLGQLTLTTGANTLGIGSFATATAMPWRARGTGNANLPPLGDLAATDQALSELFGESDERSVVDGNSNIAPLDVAARPDHEPAKAPSKPTDQKHLVADELELGDAADVMEIKTHREEPQRAF